MMQAVTLQALKDSPRTSGSAEGTEEPTKPGMRRWRRKQRANQNSSAMLLMLTAQTRIHYSMVQEDVVDVCVCVALCRLLQSWLMMFDRCEIR